jgi:hypothetical protein
MLALALIAGTFGALGVAWGQSGADAGAPIPSGGLFGQTLRADGAKASVAGPGGVLYVAGSG